jgi:hypothetical protein
MGLNYNARKNVTATQNVTQLLRFQTLSAYKTQNNMWLVGAIDQKFGICDLRFRTAVSV